MAQLNITLNQDEILQLMSNDREGAFKKLLQDSLNSILKAESDNQIGAEPYQRSDARLDYRNGSRERDLITRIGTITLKVPRHRDVPFKTMIFDNYSRSEAALIATMTELVVNGVSTRKVGQVVLTLCGTSFSKSTVSELCKELDKNIQAFRDRPLTEDYPFVIVDATYFKVREDHKIIAKALMIAYAVNDKGRRDIIGFGSYPNESKETWMDFLSKLKARGLKGLKLVTSDAHEGIRYALSRVFPEVPWQRCQFHFMRNILTNVPKKYQEGLRCELQEMFNCPTLEDARRKRDSIIEDYSDIAEKAMQTLDEGFDSTMTVMLLPEPLRKLMRTSNHIERLNKELKRRSNVIGIFPNEASLERLMGAVLMELNDRSQSKNPLFYQPAYHMLLEQSDKLISVAKEQRLLLVA